MEHTYTRKCARPMTDDEDCASVFSHPDVLASFLIFENFPAMFTPAAEIAAVPPVATATPLYVCRATAHACKRLDFYLYWYTASGRESLTLYKALTWHAATRRDFCTRSIAASPGAWSLHFVFETFHLSSREQLIIMAAKCFVAVVALSTVSVFGARQERKDRSEDEVRKPEPWCTRCTIPSAAQGEATCIHDAGIFACDAAASYP